MGLPGRVLAVLVGVALVFAKFPKREEERRLPAGYHADDEALGKTPPRAEPAPGP